MKVFFHADDFGVTYEQSKSILECFEKGCLNSVSIIPNSKETVASFELIKDYVASKQIRLVIHLNFVEGACMADSQLVPHLIDDNGNFNCTYGSMLKLNYSRQSEAVCREFVHEIRAQIAAIVALTNDKKICVDSHQHYLQIPMIWKAFMEVVEADGYELIYVRNPVDPIKPLLTTPGLLFKVPIINFVKWGLLKFLSPNFKRLKQQGTVVPTFFGIVFTCQMTTERVSMLLPKYTRYATAHDNDLELMFHPGAVRQIDCLMDKNQQDLVEFYGSVYRDLEKETLCVIMK